MFRGNRDFPLLHFAVDVRFLPEQPVAAEGVQLVHAVRRVHGRRGARPARRVHHLLVESGHTIHHSRRDDHARGSME